MKRINKIIMFGVAFLLFSCTPKKDTQPIVEEAVVSPTPDSSSEREEFLDKLIADKLRPPLDTTNINACLELMENSYSLSEKLFQSNLETSPEGQKVISVGLLVYMRGKNLLDSSEQAMSRNNKKAYKSISEKFENRFMEFYNISAEYIKSIE